MIHIKNLTQTQFLVKRKTISFLIKKVYTKISSKKLFNTHKVEYFSYLELFSMINIKKNSGDA